MPTGSPPERQRACTWSRSWDLWWPAGSRSKHPGRNPETPGEVHKGNYHPTKDEQTNFWLPILVWSHGRGLHFFPLPCLRQGCCRGDPVIEVSYQVDFPWHRASIRNRSMSRHSSAARSSCSSRRSGLSHHHRPPSSLENWPIRIFVCSTCSSSTQIVVWKNS